MYKGCFTTVPGKNAQGAQCIPYAYTEEDCKRVCLLRPDCVAIDFDTRSPMYKCWIHTDIELSRILYDTQGVRHSARVACTDPGTSRARLCICMCVCMYICMYVCMYVCMCVCMCVCTYVCMCVCMYACMHACVYVCMYVCMYACMYVCMYVCIRIRMCMYGHTYVCTFGQYKGMYILVLNMLHIIGSFGVYSQQVRMQLTHIQETPIHILTHTLTHTYTRLPIPTDHRRQSQAAWPRRSSHTPSVQPYLVGPAIPPVGPAIPRRSSHTSSVQPYPPSAQPYPVGPAIPPSVQPYPPSVQPYPCRPSHTPVGLGSPIFESCFESFCWEQSEIRHQLEQARTSVY